MSVLDNRLAELHQQLDLLHVRQTALGDYDANAAAIRMVTEATLMLMIAVRELRLTLQKADSASDQSRSNDPQ